MWGPLSIRLLAHNIRYATNAPFEGEERWEIRQPRLINELSLHTSHCDESFVCLLEVLHGQLIDILSGLKVGEKSWTFTGVGRDEFSDIVPARHLGTESPNDQVAQ